MGIQVDVGELAGLVLEAILYGIFLCLSGATLHSLMVRSRRRQTKMNVPMLAATAIMLLVATAQIAVDTVNVFKGFIDLTRQQRLLFFVDASTPIFAAKHAIYFTMMFIGDTIVIYRAFVIWNRNFWIVLFPTLCSVGSAVCGYQTIWAIRHIATASVQSETAWGLALFSLSLAANSIATGLIAYKIWRSERRLKAAMGGVYSTRSKSGSSLFPLIFLVIESGFMNAAYLLAYIIVLRSGSHGAEIMADISTPYVGIIFTSLIIRAGRSDRDGQPSMAPSTQRIHPVRPTASLPQSEALSLSMQWSVAGSDRQEGDSEDVLHLQKMTV